MPHVPRGLSGSADRAAAVTEQDYQTFLPLISACPRYGRHLATVIPSRVYDPTIGRPTYSAHKQTDTDKQTHEQMAKTTRQGRDGTGRDGTGRDGTGRDGTGRDGTGRDGKGREGKGREGKGREGKGRDGTGRDGTGRDGTVRDGTARYSMTLHGTALRTASDAADHDIDLTCETQHCRSSGPAALT